MLCAIVFFLLFLFTKNAAAENNISFVEIMPNPDGTDTKANEYFKLKNYSGEIKNIDNYRVCNTSNECYLLKGTILANSCFKLFRTDFIFTLHNDKEELKLFDSTDNLIGSTSTGEAPSGKSWLCSENYCKWGEAREACDYSDIIDPATNKEEENNDNQGDTSPSPSDEHPSPEGNDTESVPENKNTNINSSKKAKTIFEIASVKDWKKIEEEMDRKNLLSLAVNVEGKIVVPYNIVKSNGFYIRGAERLIQVSVYASRQNELKEIRSLYQAGTKIRIKNGNLKNSQQNWQLGIGKDAKVEIAKNKKYPVETRCNASLLNSKDIQKYQGKLVEISGEILKKNGQYFYLANKRDNPPVTVYIPTIVWNKYLNKENIGAFPQLVSDKIITATEYKGKHLKITGVVERSGNTYRVLAINENDIVFDKENKKNVETVYEPPLQKSEDNIQKSIISSNNAVPSTKPELTSISEEEKARLKTEQNNNLEFLKITLAQKLNWKNIWGVVSLKIKKSINGLF